MSDPFRDFSLTLFSLIESKKFKNKRANMYQQKNQTMVFKKARRRNLRYYNASRDGNPKRENEMDSPRFSRSVRLQAYVR